MEPPLVLAVFSLEVLSLLLLSPRPFCTPSPSQGPDKKLTCSNRLTYSPLSHVAPLFRLWRPDPDYYPRVCSRLPTRSSSPATLLRWGRIWGQNWLWTELVREVFTREKFFTLFPFSPESRALLGSPLSEFLVLCNTEFGLSLVLSLFSFDSIFLYWTTYICLRLVCSSLSLFWCSTQNTPNTCQEDKSAPVIPLTKCQSLDIIWLSS